jgi:hypothetical protein
MIMSNNPSPVAFADDHQAQSLVTIVDEPCITSDELSEAKANMCAAAAKICHLLQFFHRA